jgi:hypothetical protein
MSSSGKILGSFGKAVAGSVSVNLGASAGKYCEITCLEHPDNPSPQANRACYAARTEKRPDRSQLAEKLRRHEGRPPALLIGAALVELRQLVERGQVPPWIRLSTNGSLPKPKQASPLFIAQLRAFLAYAKDQSIAIHFPVESRRKARFYRRHVGDLVVVRESLQGVKAVETAEGPVSLVAGAEIQTGKGIRKRRVEAARALARRRREATGRKCIVCPAVVVSFFYRSDPDRRAKAKCGRCTACAEAHVDVIYPLH